MVLDELRFGHIASVCGEDDFMVRVDFESVRQLCCELLRIGSPVAFKLGSLCGSTPTTKEIFYENPLKRTIACVKSSFTANEPYSYP
jgi:ABC-type polysaccharide/polyol phosphate export permease